MKDKPPTPPRIAALQQACEAAGLKPEDVLQRAGIHRAAWFRWRSGTFSPSMKSWDAVQAVLAQAGPPPRGDDRSAAA